MLKNPLNLCQAFGDRYFFRADIRAPQAHIPLMIAVLLLTACAGQRPAPIEAHELVAQIRRDAGLPMLPELSREAFAESVPTAP